MRKPLMVGTCLAALALSGSANAASFRIERSSNGHIIHLVGEIQYDDPVWFINALVAQGVQRNHAIVYLESPGGNVIGGEIIGALVHEWGFATYIAPNQVCASMCADIWLAGSTRYFGDSARVGFHQAWFPGKDGQAVSSQVMNTVRERYYEYLGLLPGQIKILLQKKPEEMLWLTPAKADELHITYQIWRPS
jgi:hypothetical protein